MPKTAGKVIQQTAQATGTPQGLNHGPDPTNPLNLAGTPLAPGQLRVLAVDPGDSNVGMAVGVAFAHNDPDTGRVPEGGADELIVTHETGRIDGIMAVDVAVNAGWVDILVVEDWHLYPDKVQELIGSPCNTARMIGALEHLTRKYNRWAATVEGRRSVEVVLQPASVQAVAKSALQRLGVGRTSAKTEVHALSAELHFWNLVLSRRELLG
jgi:RNase H-fold protein (predicted Holliday junction resolvase)